MTAIVLERLLEPNSGRSAASSDRDNSENNKKPLSARLRLPLFSPAAPPPLPVPDSFSPSPSSSSAYAVTGESGGSTWPTSSCRDGLEVRGEPDACGGEGDEESGRLDASWRGEAGRDGLERADLDRGGNDDDFLSPRETRSVTSCESSAGFGNRTPNHTEFYDAIEDFMSDGSVSQSSPSLNTKNENELHALRLNLIEEIGRRKTAEMALLQMQNQWQRLAENLSKVGVSFPAIQQAGVQFEIDPAAICQEILYARLVSEAIERGLARAETEAAAEAVVDTKNRQISRLRDRLHYYEVVNREMSLRNQEIAELAHQRLRRRARWRWIWSCIGLSVTLGASLFASSYLEYSADDLITLFCRDDHVETSYNGPD